MSDYEVIVKKVEPMTVASVRGTVEAPQAQGKLWAELVPQLQQRNIQPAGNWLALYYHNEEPDGEWDIEVAMPVPDSTPDSGGVSVRKLSGSETTASVMHRGPWMTVGQAYEALRRWMEANGYTPDGPFREIGLRDARTDASGQGQDQTDANLVVEVQVPVVRR